MSNTILTFWFLFQVCWHQLHMMSPFSQAVFTDYLQKDRLGEAFIKRFFYEQVLQRGGHFFSFPMKASLSWLYFVWINVSFTALQYISPSSRPSLTVLSQLVVPEEYCASHTVPKSITPRTLCPRGWCLTHCALLFLTHCAKDCFVFNSTM